MSTRTWTALLAVVLAGALSAQTSVSFSQSVTDSSERRYLLEVDQGPTPTAVTVTIDLTTPSVSGITAWVIDLDKQIQDGMNFSNGGHIPGVGSTSINYQMPVRDGAHQLVLHVTTYDWGPPSTFSGTATVSTGTIALLDTIALPYLELDHGNPRNVFGREIEFFGEAVTDSAISLDFSLDFGSTAQTASLRFQASCMPGNAIRLIDMGSTPPVALLEWSGSFGIVDDITTLTTPAFSGVRPFRVEYLKPAGNAVFVALITFSADVSVVSVAALIPSAPPPSGRSSAGQSTCAASLTGGIVAPLLPALALVRRRRRGVVCVWG